MPDKPMDAEIDIPLAEMIETLRRELAIARDEGRGRDLQFSVGDAELELEIAVSRRLSRAL
jgi:hypothetical protein